MSYRVYISHSVKDSELAKDLTRRLAEVGVEVLPFVAKADTNSGMRAAILDRARAADEVIVLLTDNSADSVWVRYEIGAADSMDKLITPVVVNEDVEQRVPMLSSRRAVKYADLPKYLSSLKKRAQAA